VLPNQRERYESVAIKLRNSRGEMLESDMEVREFNGIGC
jgi:hypothetical protein